MGHSQGLESWSVGGACLPVGNRRNLTSDLRDESSELGICCPYHNLKVVLNTRISGVFMSDRQTSVFAFLPFRLDPAQRSLSREGQPVTLTPKEFDTLLVLLEAGGRVVDKEELIARVWPDSYVGDGSLARNISVLRKALGEEVIETHRGRGYRIALPVVLMDSMPTASTHQQDQPQTDVPVPSVETVGQTGWWRGKVGLACAALVILVLAFAASRFFAVNSAKAHMSASGMPIRSIMILKDGAIDPRDEGFKLARPDGNYPHALYNREADGWDRWRIETNDQNFYVRALSAEEKDFALHRDWKLTCICALEMGGGFADVDFAGKGPRFDIELLQEGNRYFVALTKQISPKIELDEKIEFPGVADVAHPHTYELRYDHASGTASLWIDGKLMASGYRGHHQFQEDLGVMFGVAIYGSAAKSSIAFRQVRFEAN